MKNIKEAEMELIGTGFSKKIIMDRQTSLRLFTTNFSPLISTKRIVLHRRWLELIYAMPYVVLRREISNSFAMTKNVLTSPVKQIWNIFVRLEFPHGRYEYLCACSEREAPAGIKEESAILNYPLSIITTHPPAVSHDPSVTIYNKYDSLKHGQSLIRKTVSVEQREIPLSLRESEIAHHQYRYLERETPEIVQTTIRHLKPSSMRPAAPLHEKSTAGIEAKEESAVTNYQLPIITHHPPAVSHKPARAYIMKRSFSLPRTEEVQLDTPWMKKAPIYHTYPKMEHLASTNTEIVKEKVMEKEIDSKPQHPTPQPPSIDVNRLADQIYQLIERKVRIERERRGL